MSSIRVTRIGSSSLLHSLYNTSGSFVLADGGVISYENGRITGAFCDEESFLKAYDPNTGGVKQSSDSEFKDEA